MVLTGCVSGDVWCRTMELSLLEYAHYEWFKHNEAEFKTRTGLLAHDAEPNGMPMDKVRQFLWDNGYYKLVGLPQYLRVEVNEAKRRELVAVAEGKDVVKAKKAAEKLAFLDDLNGREPTVMRNGERVLLSTLFLDSHHSAGPSDPLLVCFQLRDEIYEAKAKAKAIQDSESKERKDNSACASCGTTVPKANTPDALRCPKCKLPVHKAKINPSTEKKCRDHLQTCDANTS